MDVHYPSTCNTGDSEELPKTKVSILLLIVTVTELRPPSFQVLSSINHKLNAFTWCSIHDLFITGIMICHYIIQSTQPRLLLGANLLLPDLVGKS